MTKKRVPFEELPITVEGPVYVARIKGQPITFFGETKMQALKVAREFQQTEPKKARRIVRGARSERGDTNEQ